jgi:hypothetical protein
VKTAIRLLLAAVGVTIGVVAVVALREATLSTHQPIAPDSQIEVVVAARLKNAEPGQTLDEMVEAQLVACRLEVSSDIVGDIEPVRDGSHFRAVLAPSMDETDRRQFRGCLEDWRIDSFRLDVTRLAELGDDSD